MQIQHISRYDNTKMFTGIIATIGEIQRVNPSRLTIAANSIAAELNVGGSIAISGACLTAISVDPVCGLFVVELSPETLRRTKLGALQPGGRVNLELPLRLSDRLGGHLVQGHIDTVGEVASIEPQGEFSLFAFQVDRQYGALLVEKGSIAIDGVSLTPFHITEGRFEVAVIPHTLRATTLQVLRPGDKVNVEFDLIAKYAARQLEKRRP